MLCNKQTNSTLHYLWFGSVTWSTMLTIIGIELGSLVIVMSLFTQLRFNSRDMVDADTSIAFAISFCFIPCWSKIKIVYLCSEINCLYIAMQN